MYKKISFLLLVYNLKRSFYTVLLYNHLETVNSSLLFCFFLLYFISCFDMAPILTTFDPKEVTVVFVLGKFLGLIARKETKVLI